MRRRQSLFACVVLCVVILLGVTTTVAQVNTATLTGLVTDPQGLAVRGAKVTATSLATGASRTATADEGGRYVIVGLVPGEYKIRVDGAANFAPYENPSVQVTVGQEAILNVRLALGTQTQVVTVTTESAPVETTRSESAQSVEERQIDNLPINGRNYINFTLINSQTVRDNSNPIGPAPNSGLSISGSRARSNMVSVDGADAVDSSVDGIRSTVSQEAVQEFQMILSNYNAEYGRATGGVVNIVTKSGSNDFHGDLFGYFRNRSFQARNPFSFDVDPATGDLDPFKQAYTRVQTGFTAGGALKKDKTFYFLSYEYTQREETGFSSIGAGNFGLSPLKCGTGCPLNGLPLTTDQANAVNQLLQAAATSGNPALAAQLQTVAQDYATIMGSAASVATNGVDFGALVTSLSGPPGFSTLTPVNQVAPGLYAEFPFPVACPSGQTVNSVNCSGVAAIGPGNTVVAAGAVPLPTSFVPLNSIRGNFPVMEKTSLWSVRLDQRWNNRNTSFIRVGVSPSQVTGIQSTSQNQVLGENSGSRVGASHYRDINTTFQNDTILSDSAFNEFRFQFARRGDHFGFSPLPGGSDTGVNIPGVAFFGQEPYSPVDRIERRFQFTDNATLTRGRHTFKIGVDYNLLQLRSAKQQIFQLDFGGDVTFGGLSANTFGLPNTIAGINLPGATALQAYGLGDPIEYIQGIGVSNQPFDDIPIGFFAQDSWRVTSKLTLNYGLRYDPDITPLFAPASAINAAAEQALGVREGIPRQYKDISPRFGLAWDPVGNGKTVVRAGYGLFYDHPLFAIAFDSVTADGARSVQLLSAGGQASACGLITVACGGGLDSPSNLNGSSIFQGVLNTTALPNMYYEPNQQRFNPYPSDSLFAGQNYLTAGIPLPILPFTLPVEKNFKYGYAEQANLTIERVIKGNWKISAGTQWTRGIHLYRPIDVNSTDPQLLTTNLANADAIGLGFTNPITVVVPSGTGVPNSCLATGTNSSILLVLPGALGVGYPGSTNCTGAPLGYIGTPAFFNFFRPSGPNPSFATGLGLAAPQCANAPNPFACGYAVQQALAGAAGFPVGFGVPVPYNSVDTQASNASSWYNALTINVEKRFSKHFMFLSSYTWSHSIDDGTDLQSTSEPQDSRFPWLEKSNSDNDQRHRWVTSGVFQTSPHAAGESFVNSFFGNFTVAPLIEVSSGRPFTVISNEDTRLEISGSEARPSVVPANTAGATTSPFIHNVAFVPATICLTNSGQPFTVPGITPSAGCDGNLGRNAFTMPMFFQFDLRISKGINLGEHMRLDLIADGFNLLNHTNIIAVNAVCDPTAGSTCAAGQPTAAADARQFQFALKLNW